MGYYLITPIGTFHINKPYPRIPNENAKEKQMFDSLKKYHNIPDISNIIMKYQTINFKKKLKKVASIKMLSKCHSIWYKICKKLNWRFVFH